jgi:hypothetical protein
VAGFGARVSPTWEFDAAGGGGRGGAVSGEETARGGQCATLGVH